MIKVLKTRAGFGSRVATNQQRLIKWIKPTKLIRIVVLKIQQFKQSNSMINASLPVYSQLNH